MTKRVKIVEQPFNGIQVGDKVMFISTSFNSTRVNYGFYRGFHKLVPVVEYFQREKKWRWNDRKLTYSQDKDWTISSKRVFLSRERIYNCHTLQSMFDDIPTKESLAELIKKDLSKSKKPG